jgi:folate-binding protein YgfZ
MSAGPVARVVARDVLEVSGPDARSYLQGQCSQDIDALAPGDSAETLVLSPQGKVDAYARITRTGDEAYLLDTDAGCGEAARARLERFRLRTKVVIGTAAWSCLSVRGVAAGAVAVPTGPTLALPVEWPGWVGVDLLGPTPEDDPDLVAWVPEGAERVDDETFEAARIEAGVPVGGREVTESTIAAEAGLVERTVSFTKGCFTGQELVARLDARGSKVARHLWGLVVDGGARPPVGATVWTLDGGHEVGTLTSVAWSTVRGATVALATLHRRIEPPVSVAVRWDDEGATAEVRPLPLSPA